MNRHDPSCVTQLEEHRSTALAAYYLGRLAPSPDHSAPSEITTPEDLYEYLLIDPLVSAKVETSRVAEGIASIQQHINAVFHGMEPGYGTVADGAQRRELQDNWREAMGEYSRWSGYQMLADYPENYLDPTLRLGKTEAFQVFEDELSQTRLTRDSVQRALGNYLGRFEEVSNLCVEACFIDGLNFGKAAYYFVGKRSTAQGGWYWRSAAIDVSKGDSQIPPSAWSEWKQIDALSRQDVLHVRPVVLGERLHLVWMEFVRQEMDASGTPVEGRFIYQLKISFLLLNGQWSPPETLQEIVNSSPESLKFWEHELMVVPDAHIADQFRLIVVYLNKHHTQPTGAGFMYVYDRLWRTLSYTEKETRDLYARLQRIFSAGARRVQYPLELLNAAGEAVELAPVRWNHATSSSGPLHGYLELNTQGCIIDGEPHVQVQGVCQRPFFGSDGVAPLCAAWGVWKDTPGATLPIRLNGAARTLPYMLRTHEGITLTVGDPDGQGLGASQFSLEWRPRADTAPQLAIANDGGTFLDLGALGIEDLRYVRLNTAMASELAQRAALTLESALGWEAQHIAETPFPGSNERPPLDFNGANGRYFWELFFHAPHLVAWRSHQELDYASAEHWLNLLFDPRVRVAPLYPPPSEVEWMPYWTCRPLGLTDSPTRDLDGPVDPDAIAYGAPSHYRKAVFMLYQDNLIAWGDSLYRQQTRDSLSEAQLHYARALSLLGPLSKGRSISTWQPVSLASAASGDETGVVAFEAPQRGIQPSSRPLRSNGLPWVRLLDAPWFRLPVNTRLLDLWDRLDLRLSNLRNNLSLDGRPLNLALYEPPANPRDLLRAQLAGNGAWVRRLGSMPIIPPYRFKAMLPRAEDAVHTLMRFGDQVRTCLESHDRLQQEELNQADVLTLSAFTQALEEQAIEQALAVSEGLVANQATVRARLAYYGDLIEADVSLLEHRADDNLDAARDLNEGSGASNSFGLLATLAPNTLVMANPVPPVFVPGGWNWGGPALAAASVLDALAGRHLRQAESQQMADTRQRRRQEWDLQLEQAQRELETLERQIESQAQLVESARTRSAQASKAREQADALHAYLVGRATRSSLYQWLLGQMSTLYFQAYDAVLSLCLATEASWQHETGDGDSRFVPLTAWSESRHGLTAGESLLLGLRQMESAYLTRDQRRLELVKTVSLRRLIGEGEEEAWNTVIANLRSSGRLEFALTPRLFDRDYPGHYLRQLASVSLSFPGLLGPYQQIRAILTQSSSSYLAKAHLGGCKYQYEQAGELEGEHDDVDHRFVVVNPQVNQQVALSVGSDDSGLHTTSLQDERYLPFEGTGALSNWTLAFPRYQQPRQQALFDALNDIVVQVRYYAVDGGKQFATQVKGLDTSRQATTRSSA